MCRKVGNVEAFQKDIEGMNTIFMPYDSDCIDELIMPTSFNLNPNFDDLSGVTAKIVLPIPVQIREEEEPRPPCIFNAIDDSSCYLGMFNAFNVTFPDVFNSTYKTWLEDSYRNLPSEISKDAAIYFHDLAPTDESGRVCDPGIYIPKGLNTNNIPCLDSWVSSKNTPLFNSHSTYSKQILQLANRNFNARYIRSDVATVGMPNSITFAGSKVPSSWQGMKR